jgi:NAD+--asparagine ADP-ribosyltransferase
VTKALKWKTSNDELVCPVCGALHGQTVALEGAFFDALSVEQQAKLRRRFEVPPAHPGCRCRVAAVVEPA